jgi:hypothetical protein
MHPDNDDEDLGNKRIMQPESGYTERRKRRRKESLKE